MNRIEIAREIRKLPSRWYLTIDSAGPEGWAAILAPPPLSENRTPADCTDLKDLALFLCVAF